MSKRSLKLQSDKFREIENINPYKKKLTGFLYMVLSKVYAGGPDTELLCLMIDVNKGEDLWDIGTGTGLVALAAKRKGAKYVLATDLSPYAIKNAKLNSRKLGLKIKVKKANVFGGIKRRFDVITFNPPFTDHGVKKDYQIMFWDKGNKATKTFFSGLRSHIKPGGRAFIVWSSFGSRGLLGRLARRHKLKIEHKGRREGSDKLHYDVYKITPR